MPNPTRRDFLKLVGTGAIANASLVRGAMLEAATAQPAPAEYLRMWVTDDDRRLEAAAPLPLHSGFNDIAENAIAITPEIRYQPIRGFGAAFTDGSCYMFNQMPGESRAALFHTLFHPSEMGLNVCRTCIGSADAATHVYSYDDGPPDPDLTRFSIDYDRRYILPILRQARAVNPDLFLFSSPWSPPGWMKDNGSMLGGCMRHTYMPSYARYFVKFLESYAAEGVPIQAVTVQNEVDADQQGLMPACFWPQEYETTFVSDHLGPEFERRGVPAKIWIIDHNYNLWGRAIAELETANVKKYAGAVAWHGYVGQPEWMSRVHEAFPGIEMHWTEGSPDYNDPEYSRCWALWAEKMTHILDNWCQSITGWCFATDEHGRPNIGPYPCGGMVTVDSRTKTVYHSGQYFAMAHFSRFIKRGAVRIGSSSTGNSLSHCAFRNSDGSTVVVLTNAGPAQVCLLVLRGKGAQISVPANSVVTLTSSDAARAVRGA